MPQDDAADLVGLLEEDKAEALLEKLPEKDREELTQLLQYDEESAGGLMTPYVVAILSGNCRAIQNTVNLLRANMLTCKTLVVEIPEL